MVDGFRILLIEDSLLDARAISSALDKSKYQPFRPVFAGSLAEGRVHLQQGQIDAVLLDLSLPDSAGMNTFVTLQREFSDVPIVILTGSENEELAIQMMQHGAQDYLVKWNTDSLSLFRALRYAIERNNRRHAEANRCATDFELQTARVIQRALFPAATPKTDGFDIGGTWHPAQAVCGDYFDFMPIRDRLLGVAVGDVCGHGLGPALVMAGMRACLRTLALTHFDAGAILTAANKIMTEDLAGDRFVTLFFTLLDPANKTISYAAAGHRAYLIHADGKLSMLDATSVPLGLSVDTVVPCAPLVQLLPGDNLLIITDGIEEATSPEGQAFGLNRVLATVDDHRWEPAQLIVERLVHKLLPEFTRRPSADDDFTAVLIKVT